MARSDGESQQPARRKNPRRDSGRRTPNADGHRARSPSPVDAAREAVRQLAELIGRQPEGVVGVSPDEDGWLVDIEVLEARRIPATTDVLACYQARLDERCQLREYRRTSRYLRGALRGGSDDLS